MSTGRDYLQGLTVLKLMSDRDWITILSSLIRDKVPESQKLARFLLTRTKHGRQIQLLQLLKSEPQTVPELQRRFKVSRRSVFRDLNDLETHGVRFNIGEGWRYEVQRVPPNFARLMPGRS